MNKNFLNQLKTNASIAPLIPIVDSNGDVVGYYAVEVNSNDILFAELIVKECIDIIEAYRIPCGNSASGELACEWTYDALKDIRDSIKEKFGIVNN